MGCRFDVNVASAAFLSCCVAVAAFKLNAAGRPYEMVEAGRVADENAPPLVSFCDTVGWTVDARNAVASLSRSTEQLLFGDGVARLAYRATGTGTPAVTVRPAEAIAITGCFDTVTCWIYGNNFNGKSPPGTPSVSVVALFADGAGEAFSIPLANVHHKEWSLFRAQVPASRLARVSAGGSFFGLEISGGTNLEDRAICFSSLCVFKERRRPLSFAKRPKRNVRIFANQPQGANDGDGRLPFPTVKTTVVPVVAEDSNLEFRFPGDGESWDALAFRYGGSRWIPIAQGGGTFPRAAGANPSMRFCRIGNSVVADIFVEGGYVEEVRFGAMALPEPYELIAIPYYTYLKLGGNSRPYVVSTKVDGTPIFISCTMDWTQSNASELFPALNVYGDACAANGGVRYNPKTDGVRNSVCERFVWTVSTNFQQTLPVVPNPASPWRHVAGTHAWRHHGTDKYRENDRRYWRDIRRKGIRHVLATDHETMWRDGFESFSFRTKPAPAKGGDKGLYDYTRFLVDELGYRYGPYNNFTDLAPVNANWHSDNVLLTASGDWKESWARCYSPKPLYGVEKCLELTPQIQAKFGFNAGYCDVHTCVSPWGRTDYDARVPGAATFAQTFYAYGEILLAQKRFWNGPVLSEGGIHWMYAGLSDGNYAQETTYLLAEEPWLVDFDLLRIHPLCCNYGVGLPYMFYRRGRPKGGRWDFVDPFIGCTIAFGHAPILLDGEHEAYSYFMLQALAAAYTQADVRGVRYLDSEGVPLDTSAAVSSGAYKRSQILARYSDGTLVAVNGDRDGHAMKFRFGGKVLELPMYGFLGVTTNVVSFSGNVGGVRASFAKGPEYFYLCTRNGKWTETQGGGTDGEMVRLFGRDGSEEVISFGAKRIKLPYAAVRIIGLDKNESRSTGEVPFELDEKGHTVFDVQKAAYSYRVTRSAGWREPDVADYLSVVICPNVEQTPRKERTN